MPKVQIYTTATCVYCKAEKDYLRDHKIEFEELAADGDPALAEQLFKLSGQYAVPFSIVTKADGSKEQILGFDRSRLAAALGL